MIRNATLGDKSEMFDLMFYCFPGPKGWQAMMQERFAPDNFLVFEEENKVISASLEIVPYNMNICGRLVKAGGIAVVASRPDFRYSGNTGKLMTEAIKRMNSSGMVYSALAPFSFEFYRKYGWEQSYDLRKYEIDIPLLKKFLAKNAKYELYKNKAFDLWSIRDEFFGQFNGSFVIPTDNQLDFHRLCQHLELQVVSLKENEEVVGYMVYHRDGEVFNVREIVWKNVSALKSLLGYIYRHNAECEKTVIYGATNDPIRLLLDEQNVSTKNIADMMLRIVNVEKALMNSVSSAFDDEVVLKVKDTKASWNNGCFLVKRENGVLTVSRTSGLDYDLALDIQTLTQWSIGYLSYQELKGLDKLDIQNGKDLENLFVKRYTYMNERF